MNLWLDWWVISPSISVSHNSFNVVWGWKPPRTAVNQNSDSSGFHNSTLITEICFLLRVSFLDSFRFFSPWLSRCRVSIKSWNCTNFYGGLFTTCHYDCNKLTAHQLTMRPILFMKNKNTRWLEELIENFEDEQLLERLKIVEDGCHWCIDTWYHFGSCSLYSDFSLQVYLLKKHHTK